LSNAASSWIRNRAGLSGTEVSDALSGVMDQNDGGLVAAQQAAQVVESRGTSAEIFSSMRCKRTRVEHEQGEIEMGGTE
jgi:hypothetical protein